MKIIAQQNFNLNGVFYEKGDEVTKLTKEQVIKLNEKGFIEPLTPKQIQEYDKEDVKEKKLKIKED